MSAQRGIAGLAERETEAGAGSAPRIALYSHDAVGIGHVRRNLLIAQTLAAPPLCARSLIIAGVRDATAFAMPPGVDCLTLPSLCKSAEGDYEARSLNVPLQELLAVRANVIHAAIEAFRPDVLIVDKVPRGVGGELDQTLEDLRAAGRTYCVLGLREVLDDPLTVRREWREAGNEECVRRFYDAVWVYGDVAVFDPVREYNFSSELAAKVQYTGYFNQHSRLKFANDEHGKLLEQLDLPPGRFVLCVVGGGEDGGCLAEAFLSAALPPETHGVLLTGPFMPPVIQRRLHDRAAQDSRFRVIEFLKEPGRLVSHADRIIAMGGYNTVCEVLSFNKLALIVPRVKPRREQLIRTERLRDLGLVEMLHPDDLSPQALTAWLMRDIRRPLPARDRVDFDGLVRLPKLLKDVLAGPPARRKFSEPQEGTQRVAR